MSAPAESKIQLFKNESEWNSIYEATCATKSTKKNTPNKKQPDGYGKFNTIFGIKWKIRVKEKQCYISNKCTVQDAYLYDIETAKTNKFQKEKMIERKYKKQKHKRTETDTHNSRYEVKWCGGVVHLS